ncbi:MAG: hypothetical protein QOE71_4121 [Pseudonocardiales bacterium]|nr:hypothetical protein [Pseudonocardiales bacterium]MDQ1753065.1 hypothetical protein [Pseudonocardiales bacterium]
MSDLLFALAEVTEGLFTSEQARQCGVDQNGLASLLGSGSCLRLRRGLYVVSARWPAEPQRRHLLIANGIYRQHGGRIAASHHTSAIAAGLPTWGVPYSRPSFTRIGGLHTTGTAELRIGKAWPADAVDAAPEFPRIRPGVAALQIAMSYGVESALVTLDAALSARTTDSGELYEWLDRLRGYRHCTRARAVVDLADARSESPGESRLRYRLHGLGYLDLEPQVELRDGGRFVARVDLYDEGRKIAVEFDGAVKYEGAEGQSALIAEKRREDELRLMGFSVVRFAWSDLGSPVTLKAKMDRAHRVAAGGHRR